MPMKVNRVRNWGDYNKTLVKRGEITLWISDAVLQASPHKKPQKGRPFSYHNALIEASLVLKNVYQLTFRQLEGFLKSIYILLRINKKPPSYTTLCRRQSTVDIKLNSRINRQGITLVVDSTGLKVVGEGEWCVKQHGTHYQRTWRKIHLAVDARNLDILSCSISQSRIQDSDMLEPLLKKIDGQIDAVIGDGAYDAFKCYESITKRQARAIIPPRADARLSCETKYCKKAAKLNAIQQRDEAIEAIRERGKANWKEQSGYHQRSLAETTMYRLKTILGERLKAKNQGNQALEVAIKCQILNKMNQLNQTAN